MSEDREKRGRGRPRGEKPAQSSADRMRRLRERAGDAVARVVLSDDLPGDLTDTALLEGVQIAFRQGRPWTMGALMSELMRRTNARADPENACRVAVIADATLSDMHAHGVDWIPVPRHIVTVTPSESDDCATVVKNYPPEIKAEAVRMDQAGRSRDEIRAWLITRVGKAPDASNWVRTIKQWSRTVTKNIS